MVRHCEVLEMGNNRGQVKIDPDQRCPDDEHWTGAKIKACCLLAALLLL